MRDFFDTCVRFVRSWVGVALLVSVGVLAVIAFDVREQQEVTNVKANLHVVCQQVNAAGIELDRLSKDVERNRYSLTQALKVAQGEVGQDTSDRLEYARLRGLLDSSTVQSPSISLNCEDLK